jgi:Nitrogen regulatory protein P-II
MMLVLADAARFDAVKRDLSDLHAAGYSALPVLEGSGRTGIHAGDRVHPGGLVALFVVAADEEANHMFETMVRRRDAAEDRVTRLFLLPVERQA